MSKERSLSKKKKKIVSVEEQKCSAVKRQDMFNTITTLAEQKLLNIAYKRGEKQ